MPGTTVNLTPRSARWGSAIGRRARPTTRHFLRVNRGVTGAFARSNEPPFQHKIASRVNLTSVDTMEALRSRWIYLYSDYLPCLAQAKDPIQPSWPVHLDHCFARIVLDNAVGQDRPWTGVVPSPAVKHMTEQQLEVAIRLAERIAGGEANLVELDDRSLQLRGKKPKVPSKRLATINDEATNPTKKRKGNETISSYFLPSPSSPQAKRESEEAEYSAEGGISTDDARRDAEVAGIPVQLKRIQDSHITPFRKLTLSLLCHIPRGRYSTYQAMSDHITKTSHKTCARAVGNAMRNNPFAPEVPCHRILAADGSLGGFKGHWGEQGAYANHKHKLLHEEGVRFDSKGKVKGPPFREWTRDGGFEVP